MTGISAAIAGGSSVLNAGLSIFGSSKARKQQQNALQQAMAQQQVQQQAMLAQQQQLYSAQQGMYSPYTRAGTNALSQLDVGFAMPYSQAQLAESIPQTAWQNQQEQNRYQNELNIYQANEAARKDKGEEWDRLVQAGQLSPKAWPRDYWLNQFYQPMEPPAPPSTFTALSNEGRGALSQRTNMTPTEWFASEAAAGRAVDPSKQNWNADFDMNAWLASQGKSSTALTENFDMNAWLAGQGRTANALTRDFAMSDYEADPGYAFRLKEGNQALTNTAAARGNLLSGATLKAVSEYNSGQASQEYQNAVNRYNVNRSNLQNVAVNAQNQFGIDRSNLQNVGYKAYDMFNIDQNKLYGRFTDAYGRQANAKQIDASNLLGISTQGVNAVNQMSQNSNLYNQNLLNTQNQAMQNQMNTTIGQGALQAQNTTNTYAAIGQGIGGLANAGSKYYDSKNADDLYKNSLLKSGSYQSPDYNLTIPTSSFNLGRY